MPSYNAGQYIGEAIESILAQPARDAFELIIVDDASTDNTRDIIDAYAQRDERVRAYFLPCHTGGPAHPRNLATEKARYDYIMPHDADDKMETNPDLLSCFGTYIDRAVDTLSGHENVVMAYALGHLCGTVNKPWILLNYTERLQLYASTLPVQAVYRKEEALAIGGYDISLLRGEDWDFHTRLFNHRLKQGKERDVIKFNEPYLFYRQHDHGGNVNSRPLPLEALFTHIYGNSSEIYEHHFPGITLAKACEMMIKQRGLSLENVFHVAAKNPAWVADRLGARIERILGR